MCFPRNVALISDPTWFPNFAQLYLSALEAPCRFAQNSKVSPLGSGTVA
jgi:hypothetical protein